PSALLGGLVVPLLVIAARGGDWNCHLVGCHRRWLTMKVAATDDVARRAIAHEHHWVVRRAVQLHRGNFSRLPERVAHRAVHLRRPAQSLATRLSRSWS